MKFVYLFDDTVLIISDFPISIDDDWLVRVREGPFVPPFRTLQYFNPEKENTLNDLLNCVKKKKYFIHRHSKDDKSDMYDFNSDTAHGKLFELLTVKHIE